jgi:hypothetical protein
MNTLSNAALAIVALSAVLVGYFASMYLTRYRLMRVRRRIGCLFGRHTPGPVQPAVGGRNVQRCDWCDKVVREYEVTKGEAFQNRNKIRRIY